MIHQQVGHQFEGPGAIRGTFRRAQDLREEVSLFIRMVMRGGLDKVAKYAGGGGTGLPCARAWKPEPASNPPAPSASTPRR